MTAVLADTGLVVAFLNARDRYHDWATDALSRLRPPLLTCEAVLSEAVFLVKQLTAGPEKVLALVERGVLRPAAFELEAEAPAVRAMLGRYASVGIDLADACLVRLSELHSDCVVVTVDTEFRDVYRRHGRQAIPTLLPEGARRRKRRRP